MMNRVQELVAEIRNNSEWDMNQLQELCELDRHGRRMDAADGETFEKVAFAAAEKFGSLRFYNGNYIGRKFGKLTVISYCPESLGNCKGSC